MKVADVTSHANYFRLPLILYYQQVMELEAILAVVQANMTVREVQKVPEVHKVQKGISGSSKKVHFGGDGELVSSPLSVSRFTSWS